MKTEGMVHALEKAASCLNQGGVILEVHDLVDPPRIEVHSDNGEFFAGQLLSEDNFEDYRQADNALNHLVAAGLLYSDQAFIFENYIRADSFDSLLKYLEEEWESAYIPDATKDRVIKLVADASGDSEVVLRMVSRINLLRKFGNMSRHINP
jgi:hypothetical protein